MYAITNQVWTFEDEDTGKPVTRLASHECIAGLMGEARPKDPYVFIGPGKDPHLYVQSDASKIWMGKGFSEVHPSRSPFIPVNSGSRDQLAKAIGRCKELKPIYQDEI